MLTRDQETIIAQCTPNGKGAIALVRLCGSNVREVVSKISYLPNNNIENLSSGTVNFGFVIDDQNNKIDQVMFIIMDGPKTFTGQNTIEITCHNNPFIIQKIISQAVKHGARLAQEGEFTKRAFLNDKIDLIQAEAINELIHANTQLALKKSLSQLQGSFSNWIYKLEKELIRTLAWSQATFEFLDEEVNFNQQIKDHLLKLVKDIKILKKTFDEQQQIRQGIRIALIGSVNAGKSSIFNNLLNQKRAIVTNIAGTTRDAIESGIYLNGNYCTLIDTAGLRQTDDIIEQEGIKKSFEEAAKADIILLIFDQSREINQEEEKVYKELLNQYSKKIILIANKIDLENKTSLNRIFDVHKPIKISSNTKENFNTLEQNIELKILELFSSIESPFLLNKRHFNNLINIENQINTVIEMFNNDMVHHELVAYHLNNIIETISDLTGKTVSEAGLDMVFKEFCVGK
ncbi:tRNA uridine-5-carboxymethylaminomethyl(34) synthesis GTPase MnmE [Candidatus Babela massiliensis]|uniref:tRNA modification GTPase MnmE n=1 Tax=Candidatus Babela massiliensis TaxID=673862 RepID=V6DIC1_9BACT|nr:tRNA uridine-5-carboxymethylaminomethyl(34) synthesis GTPase MnmE [Candidatus Babela massiliensis]CDK30673.1 tRNA modification GTPase TrmE [Candidatus Babela massiliensis]